MNIKNRLKTIIYRPRIIASLTLVMLAVISVGVSASAQTVLQGYGSDQVLQRGMLVTLSDSDKGKVEAITNETLDKLKGVVTHPNDSPVTLSGEDQKVFVATTGSYEVLVSNENGTIKAGDYISGSSLAGIGMKADDTQRFVLGRAVGNFEGAGDGIGKSQLKDGRQVTFGRIKVDIGVGRNPLVKDPEKDRVPDAFQKAANAIAQKEVATLRIYLAIAVLMVTALVAGTTLFSGVRSTIISIGRNPLSKGVILRALLQVLLLSLIIFITGLFGVYLLIKL